MSLHIHAKKGDIAEIVLMPGDPLRAKYIAETYLENVHCYNQVRNMYGFTGMYQGNQISVQSSGMGVPSFLIYAEELIREFGCSIILRIGTCGSIQQEIKLRKVIIVQAAHTDSNAVMQAFSNSFFAPSADWRLLQYAVQNAHKKAIDYQVGTVFTGDLFYDDGNNYQLWRNYGTLAVDMETAGLYTVAAKHNVKALSILTVSDEIVTGKKLSFMERENSLNMIFTLALDITKELRFKE
jgi:purine-nucleoside phosphorylase